MTGCKDIKHSLIGPGKFQRTNLVRTGFWKWNRSCDWLITVKECGSVVSSRFFGGSIAWHPKKRLRRRLSYGTHSLTHSLTHSILINLFLKLELSNFLLRPLLKIIALFLLSFWCTSFLFLSLRCNISLGGEKIIRFLLLNSFHVCFSPKTSVKNRRNPFEEKLFLRATLVLETS